MLLIDVAFSRRGSTTQRKLEKFIFAGGGQWESGGLLPRNQGFRPSICQVHTHTHTHNI